MPAGPGRRGQARCGSRRAPLNQAGPLGLEYQTRSKTSNRIEAAARTAALAAVAAARAVALQLLVAAIDPESAQRRSLPVHRHRDLIEVVVPHLPAAPADEVMVVVRIHFE